jgi:hypothetical protein
MFAFVLGVAVGESLVREWRYWEKLNALLDKRDEAVFSRLRNNKDHKI